jgi:hypothetical protein
MPTYTNDYIGIFLKSGDPPLNSNPGLNCEIDKDTNKYTCTFNPKKEDEDLLKNGLECYPWYNGEEASCRFIPDPKNGGNCSGTVYKNTDGIFECRNINGIPKPDPTPSNCKVNEPCNGTGPIGINGCPNFYCLGNITKPCPSGLVWDSSISICNYPNT